MDVAPSVRPAHRKGRELRRETGLRVGGEGQADLVVACAINLAGVLEPGVVQVEERDGDVDLVQARAPVELVVVVRSGAATKRSAVVGAAGVGGVGVVVAIGVQAQGVVPDVLVLITIALDRYGSANGNTDGRAEGLVVGTRLGDGAIELGACLLYTSDAADE